MSAVEADTQDIPHRERRLPLAAVFEQRRAAIFGDRRRATRTALAELWRAAIEAASEAQRDAQVALLLDEAADAAARAASDDALLIDRLDAAMHYLSGWRDLLAGRLAATLVALNQQSSTLILRGRLVSIKPREVTVTACCGRSLGECEHVPVLRARVGSYVSIGSTSDRSEG